ncbi:MAG: hypothetical protein NC102_08985, partial [Clostridium sp.]|nr:hypothetical protein [Clostridium sp.]
MKHALAIAALFCAAAATAGEIVGTSAYTWRNDSIIQGEYFAYAPTPYKIVSTYSAQPHFFMPIDKEWTLRNDISRYPQLHSGNTLLDAVYNMGLDEMVNAVEPDTTLRTGKEWAGVWTRDVSYSIILSMAYMQPTASEVSLRRKVDAKGRIVQDTGSGGAWPISTDRMIWAVAAYELYLVNGDREWLEFAYPVIKRSMEDDLLVAYTNYGDNSMQPADMPEPGLVRGETSFIDWREQSYPKWMQTADIYESQAMGTNMVHAIALRVLANMARDLGLRADADRWGELASSLSDNINRAFWMQQSGYYGMYLYGRNFLTLNPRAETLGESLSILYDIAPADRQRAITENNPTTPFGAAIFYPQIADMPAYHNNSLWPWVGAMWALANAKVGNEDGTMQAIGAIVRPAALFATNKENFNLDNGDIATELNSSNMLWCLSGNLALTYRILFGIHFTEDGLKFMPFVPEALAGSRTLDNFPYRGAKLNIKVNGFGSRIKSFRVNGVESDPIIPAGLKGTLSVEIDMDSEPIAPMKVNNRPNLKAPLTPIATLRHDPSIDEPGAPVNNLLSWHPIEYIDYYIVLRDGREVKRTTSTEFAATVPGSYQVVGVAEDGTRSFASAPMSNLPEFFVEMPGESTEMSSYEVSYQPRAGVVGYRGKGFREVDHSTKPISFDIVTERPGLYAIDLTYANGNGPVNTENKCAIRTISIDGRRAGVVVMPHRGVGNWSDWGRTN